MKKMCYDYDHLQEIITHREKEIHIMKIEINEYREKNCKITEDVREYEKIVIYCNIEL